MWELRSEEMQGATAADTSYGIAELPDECEWMERGGVGCAIEGCAEKRKRRRPKNCSKQEGKEEKGKKHEVNYEPKKTRNRQRRLLTRAIGGLTWHQRKQPHRLRFTDSI